jgi:hypothetical protein
METFRLVAHCFNQLRYHIREREEENPCRRQDGKLPSWQNRVFVVAEQQVAECLRAWRKENIERKGEESAGRVPELQKTLGTWMVQALRYKPEGCAFASE